jgi:hypothetical protein
MTEEDTARAKRRFTCKSIFCNFQDVSEPIGFPPHIVKACEPKTPRCPICGNLMTEVKE